MRRVEDYALFQNDIVTLNIHYPGDSQAQKKRFDKKCQGAAHEVTVIKKIYSQEVLNDAASRMENLAKLIDVIRY